jgi:hypothetical protein
MADDHSHAQDEQSHAESAGASVDVSDSVITVSVTWRQLGTLLGLYVAEEPGRLTEFLQEAERLDPAYRRWEYVRGVHGVPGLGARIAGRLPAELHYTGFEGYWAGSGRTEEQVVEAEAELGIEVLAAIAGLSGAGEAYTHGFDIFRYPRTRSLYETATGRNNNLSNVVLLDPILGEALGKLRAVAERSPDPVQYAAFQSAVESAVMTASGSVYIDPGQHALLSDLAKEGRNVVGPDLIQRYQVPRAPLTNMHNTAVPFNARQRQGYQVLSEIGRLGNPTLRAMLHILPPSVLDTDLRPITQR